MDNEDLIKRMDEDAVEAKKEFDELPIEAKKYLILGI